MNKILGGFSLFFILGCSTFSKNECLNHDWYHLGAQSANNGESSSERINYYKYECTSEHGVPVDTAQFEAGFKKGLESLCSSSGGKILGSSGKYYRGTCPPDKEENFLKTYSSSRLTYLENRVRELEYRNNRLESDLSSRESRISTLESQLSAAQARTCP